MVLLPGMNCSAGLWSRLDWDGWPQLITARLTEATLDGQVGRLLDELPRRFAIGGLSLGGIVAMALTRRGAGAHLVVDPAYRPIRTHRRVPSETIGGRGETHSMLAGPRASCSWSGCRSY